MTKQKYLKKLSFAIAASIVLQGVPVNVLAQAPALKDLGKHWASEPVKGWTSKGLIKGYEDGSFKPDAYITRAQFIALVNRAFGYMTEEKVSFKDIKASDWFYKEVEKAKAVGYITGYEDGTIKPNSPITRQEAAAIVSRILKLKAEEGQNAAGQFKDADRIAKWSKDVVNAIVKEGYMKGYADGTFKPESFITRAESVVMLDRVVGELYYTAGVQGTDEVKTIKGNVTINTKDITLKNTVIEGNLYLTEGVGEGEVTLDNVTVKGKTLIGGGGPNSVTVKDSNLGKTQVSKPAGKVRILAVGKTIIQEVTANSTVKFETKDLTGTGFVKIIIPKDLPAGTVLQFAGDFQTVVIGAANIKIEVLSGKIGKFEVLPGATGTKIELAKGATIVLLIVNAPTEVKGEGKVETAEVNSDGVSFEKAPDKIVKPSTSTGGGGGGGGGGGDTPTTPTKPAITSFMGMPVTGTSITKDLNALNKDSAITVSKDSKVTFTIPGFGTFSGVELKKDTSTSIADIFVSALTQENLSNANATALFNAIKQLDPALKQEIFNEIDFTGLFDVIMSLEPEDRDAVLQGISFEVIFDVLNDADAATKKELAENLETILMMNNLTKEVAIPAYGATKDALELAISKGIITQDDFNEFKNAVIYGDNPEVIYSEILDAVMGAPEADRNEILDKIDFTALFNALKGFDKEVKDEIFEKINFTNIFDAVRKYADPEIKTAIYMDVIDSVQSVDDAELEAGLLVVLLDLLTGVSGDENALEMTITLTDKNDSTQTSSYDVTFTK